MRRYRRKPDPSFDPELLAFTEPCWWRCEVDDYGKLVVTPVTIVKHTPRGVQAHTYKGVKLILREYQHRARAYAAPTKEQAKADFIKRKAFQIRMLKTELDRAQEHLAKADPEHIALEGSHHHGKAPFSG